MAAARSRSRAPVAAAVAATKKAEVRERSVSRQPAPRATRTKKVAAASESPAPSNASAPAKSVSKAAAPMKVPAFLQNAELTEMMKRVLLVWIPAYTILFLVEKYKLVAQFVSPSLVPLFGDKGQIFSVLAFFNLAQLAVGSVFKFETCSRLNTGAVHRAEMALGQLNGNLGSMGAALIGAIVMQVPTAVIFMHVAVWAVFNWVYFLSVLMGCEQLTQVSQAVVRLAQALLFYAFIKLKLVK